VAPVSELASAVDELAGEDVTGLPAADLAAELVELRRQVDRLEAQWLRRLAAFDARGGATTAGRATTAAWLRAACRLTPAAAAAAVRTARALHRRLPGTAAALAAGDISYPHARALAHHTADLPDAVLPAAEPVLLDAARVLDPHAAGRAGAHLRHVLDPAGAAADAAAARDRRGFTLSETWAGMHVADGLLDPETGALVLAALLPLAAPAGPDDRRTPAQRRADALAEMARRTLDAGALPATGGERPHLSVVVDLPTLAATADTPGTRAADVDWTHAPLTGEAARRIACDAALTRVLTAGRSQILDVGRATRTVPAALRRALVVRDGGCIGEGCATPPAWTDAHHIRHWAHGGPTCLTNLCLLCRRCHRAVHEDGWVIDTRPDGTKIARPARAP
jgi:hypothetical protein